MVTSRDYSDLTPKTEVTARQRIQIFDSYGDKGLGHTTISSIQLFREDHNSVKHSQNCQREYSSNQMNLCCL